MKRPIFVILRRELLEGRLSVTTEDERVERNYLPWESRSARIS